MAADALLHFHSCGVAHLWAAITNQMIQTELCDEVAGLSEYSCTVLLCLCAQHWPICCKTAWNWVCVEASSGRDSHVVPCNCCLCAWSIHNQIYWWSFCALGCFILGVDFEVATKKKGWHLVAAKDVKTRIWIQPWHLRVCPAHPRIRQRGAGATGRPVIHRSEATMLPSSGCLWICHCGNSIINPVSPPAAPSRPHWNKEEAGETSGLRLSYLIEARMILLWVIWPTNNSVLHLSSLRFTT